MKEYQEKKIRSKIHTYLKRNVHFPVQDEVILAGLYLKMSDEIFDIFYNELYKGNKGSFPQDMFI